jgi:hypothetical protein
MDANDNNTSKTQEKQPPIIFFRYGHPLLTTNKRRKKIQTFEFKI